MRIFNIEIHGSGAKWFCGISREEKMQWIKDNTNVQCEVTINEFLDAPLNTEDCGCGCGGNKQNNGVSKTVSAEPTESTIVASPSGNSERATDKGRTGSKKS